MKTKTKKTQIQVRVDEKTKKEAKEVLEEIGIDTSTAVNILLKSIARNGAFPFDIRDINGFRLEKSKELKQSIKDSSNSKKTFGGIKYLKKELNS